MLFHTYYLATNLLQKLKFQANVSYCNKFLFRLNVTHIHQTSPVKKCLILKKISSELLVTSFYVKYTALLVNASASCYL